MVPSTNVGAQHGKPFALDGSHETSTETLRERLTCIEQALDHRTHTGKGAVAPNRFKSIPPPRRCLDQSIHYSNDGFGSNCGECVKFAATLINAREERDAIHLKPFRQGTVEDIEATATCRGSTLLANASVRPAVKLDSALGNEAIPIHPAWQVA